MKLLKLRENKSIKEYEKEWETQRGYKTCDNCGTRLNDGGTCPKCDDGEEDMNESLRENAEMYATKKVTPCCICKQPIEGYGNNAEPVCKGRCCDKCNREKVIPARIDKFRGGLTESYNKIDEDTANEIALMAMSALSLKEHEAQALEYDLIEGNAGKWIKDFEALPDNSDVKKLFFTFVKKSTNESYDPKDFNIDARTPFDDEMEKIYKPLATAIKEERWEDAAKEYWELKNEFDAELQSVSKKPIIGKLFKLMSIPHNNALNNYKKSIPAEYLDRKDSKNESLEKNEDEMNESLDSRVDANGSGGSRNNVHVGPGSMPLNCSYSTIDPHWDEMDYEIRKSREKDGPEFVDELHGKFSADYTGKDAVYCIVGQVKVDQSGRTYDTYYYSTIKNNWVKGSSDGTQYDSKEDAQLDLWDAQNLFVDTFGDTEDHWGNKCQLAVRIVGCKPRKRNRNNLKTNYDDDFDLTVY